MEMLDPYKGLILSGKNKAKSLLENQKGRLVQRKLASTDHPDDNVEAKDIESEIPDGRTDDNDRSADTARPSRVSTLKPLGMVSKPFSSPKRDMAAGVDAKEYLTEARRSMTEKVSGIADKYRGTEVSLEKEWVLRGRHGPKADKIISAVNKARKTGKESDYHQALLAQKDGQFHKENDRFVNKAISKLAGNFEPEYIERFGTMKQKVAMAMKGLGKLSTINKEVGMEVTQVGPNIANPEMVKKFKDLLKSKS